jgi:cob(I)alamin adenosyltransferase
MGLFYTGKGDAGSSDLGGGTSVDKTSLEMSVLGNLDELNSLLGLIRSREKSDHTRRILRTAQEDLFTIQANIAALMFPDPDDDSKNNKKHEPPVLDQKKVKKIEKWIDVFESLVNPERGFVISGENEQSAWLDYSRAIARRAERSALHLNKKKNVNPDVLAYLNRLSSLLFALARVTSKEAGADEEHPKYE